VLLFQKGAIRLDEELCAKTEEEIETYVRMGESIGTIQKGDAYDKPIRANLLL
jgi:hypothetical protein